MPTHDARPTQPAQNIDASDDDLPLIGLQQKRRVSEPSRKRRTPKQSGVRRYSVGGLPLADHTSILESASADDDEPLYQWKAKQDKAARAKNAANAVDGPTALVPSCPEGPVIADASGPSRPDPLPAPETEAPRLDDSNTGEHATMARVAPLKGDTPTTPECTKHDTAACTADPLEVTEVACVVDRVEPASVLPNKKRKHQEATVHVPNTSTETDVPIEATVPKLPRATAPPPLDIPPEAPSSVAAGRGPHVPAKNAPVKKKDKRRPQAVIPGLSFGATPSNGMEPSEDADPPVAPSCKPEQDDGSKKRKHEMGSLILDAVDEAPSAARVKKASKNKGKKGRPKSVPFRPSSASTTTPAQSHDVTEAVEPPPAVAQPEPMPYEGFKKRKLERGSSAIPPPNRAKEETQDETRFPAQAFQAVDHRGDKVSKKNGRPNGRQEQSLSSSSRSKVDESGEVAVSEMQVCVEASVDVVPRVDDEPAAMCEMQVGVEASVDMVPRVDDEPADIAKLTCSSGSGPNAHELGASERASEEPIIHQESKSADATRFTVPTLATKSGEDGATAITVVTTDPADLTSSSSSSNPASPTSFDVVETEQLPSEAQSQGTIELDAVSDGPVEQVLLVPPSTEPDLPGRPSAAANGDEVEATPAPNEAILNGRSEGCTTETTNEPVSMDAITTGLTSDAIFYDMYSGGTRPRPSRVAKSKVLSMEELEIDDDEAIEESVEDLRVDTYPLSSKKGKKARKSQKATKVKVLPSMGEPVAVPKPIVMIGRGKSGPGTLEYRERISLLREGVAAMDEAQRHELVSTLMAEFSFQQRSIKTRVQTPLTHESIRHKIMGDLGVISHQDLEDGVASLARDQTEPVVPLDSSPETLDAGAGELCSKGNESATAPDASHDTASDVSERVAAVVVHKTTVSQEQEPSRSYDTGAPESGSSLTPLSSCIDNAFSGSPGTTERIKVYCGGGHRTEPGNVAFQDAALPRILEYIKADKDAKEAILSEFMQRFAFMQGKSEAPTWFARDKLHKLLNDRRKLSGGRSAPTPKKTNLDHANILSTSRSPRNGKGHGIPIAPVQPEADGKATVFCGSQSGHKLHPGNKAYIQRVSDLQRSYLASSDVQKHSMISEFLDLFQFRRPADGGTWYTATDQWARDKVIKALRETRASKLRVEDAPVSVPVVESQQVHRFAEKDSPYIEELAFHHFAALDTATREEEPLPPPRPIPEPPRDDVSVTWKYNETSRVYLGDFSNVEFVSEVHKRFLGELMERDDITVVCQGLLDGFQNEGDFLDSIARSFRKDPHHKFRRFVRQEANEEVSYHEVDGYVTIQVSQFLAYLRMLRGQAESKTSFVIRDQLGQEEVIEAANAKDHVFYMIDVDMPKTMIRLNEEYKRNFKIKEILPGGAWCMLNHLPDQSRPFMGPNCYITPGGGYTQVHQDGHGTVDSGHSNISGFNEVVMLRRLPECHKRSACRMVPSMAESRDESKAQNMLYRLPHDDGREDKPKWATKETIESWRKKNYCPSVFILEEGQHVLINKGRLHAFRKLTVDRLPEDDCHASLRQELVSTKEWDVAPLCVSVAFDWMFMGTTPEGINREAASTLECTALCRENKCKSLAIPETVILRLAAGLPPDIEKSDREEFLLRKASTTDFEYRTKWIDIARGILPSLRHIVNQELNAGTSKNMKRHLSQNNVAEPDSTLDTTRAYVDPYGNDYFCKLCDHELSNTYYHCEGCETLLSKDFNICSLCFEEKRFLVNITMHDGKSTHMHSNRHHVGQPKSSCKCDGSQAKCETCHRSMTCSCCTCHTVFAKRCRFFSPTDLKDILHSVETIVGPNEIEFAIETEHRLNRVVMVPAKRDGHAVAAETVDNEASGASLENTEQLNGTNGPSNVVAPAQPDAPDALHPETGPEMESQESTAETTLSHLGSPFSTTFGMSQRSDQSGESTMVARQLLEQSSILSPLGSSQSRSSRNGLPSPRRNSAVLDVASSSPTRINLQGSNLSPWSKSVGETLPTIPLR